MTKLYIPLLFILFATGFLSACKQPEGLTSQEGFVSVQGRRIWYKTTVNEATATKTPLLLLHGGPGFPSYYLKPLFSLSADRPVIVFDQLDCGRSDWPGDTSRMSVNNQIAQVETLLAKLNIKQIYLYGHSYGTMLAVEYYFKHPDQIKAMILGSPCMSTQRWVADADTLISTLPDSVRSILQSAKKGIKQDAAKEDKAMSVYFATFYNRRQHLPDVDSSIMRFGTSLYTHMWGTGEFKADGTLKNYNRIPDLKDIKVPTLLIAGEFDAARPATVKYYGSLIPNSSFIMIKNAGHSTMNDAPGEDEKAITQFLKGK